MDDYYKRSGQIPAFGDWDYANELPITQYFECARQAGLIRFSSSSGESDVPAAYLHADLYAVDVKKMKKKPSRVVVAPNSRKTTARGREKRCTHNPHVKEQKKQQHQAKVHDEVTEPSKLHYQQYHTRRNDAVLRPRRPPKPVDEDLYKIPPELLHSTKRGLNRWVKCEGTRRRRCGQLRASRHVVPAVLAICPSRPSLVLAASPQGLHIVSSLPFLSLPHGFSATPRRLCLKRYLGLIIFIRYRIGSGLRPMPCKHGSYLLRSNDPFPLE